MYYFLSQTLHRSIKLPSQFPCILILVKRQHLNNIFFILSRQDSPILPAPPFLGPISRSKHTFKMYVQFTPFFGFYVHMIPLDFFAADIRKVGFLFWRGFSFYLPSLLLHSIYARYS
jgi:hypothetical protein